MKGLSSIKRSHGQFLLGVLLGLSMTILLQYFSLTNNLTSRYTFSGSVLSSHEQYIRQSGMSSVYSGSPGNDSDDQLHEIIDSMPNAKEQHFDDTLHHHDDDSLAKKLYTQVRVACWILTSPGNLDKKAIHVKNTWGRRCNLLLFMSSVHNDSFPTVGLNVTEGREHLTAKTMQAFKYLYENHLDDADWFLKADDDTYVILENLRYFLSEQNTEKPVYFGHRFKPIVKQGYPSGGGGYVLSKEALRRYGKDGKEPLCAADGGPEDARMGKCMQNLGVKLLPSLDAMNRTRFHCFTPETFIKGKFPGWYYSYDLEGVKWGIENVSDYAISFHYVGPPKMYELEFYIYHLRPFGIMNLPQHLNVKT